MAAPARAPTYALGNTCVFQKEHLFRIFEQPTGQINISMKVILDIKDDKAAFVMEVLKNFSFVKAKPLTPYKAEVLERLKEAVEEVNQVKVGKKKAQPLSEL
jgi:hypothetical protein